MVMGEHIDDNKPAITETKTFNFYFHIFKDVDKNLKHEIYHFIKHNVFFAGQKMKNEIDQILVKYKPGHKIHVCRKQ